MRRSRLDPAEIGDLAEVVARATYVGSSEHKTYPSFAGPPRPRADASKCDPSYTDPWPSRHIKAAGLAGDAASPLVVFPRRMPRRSTGFTLARCLWHQAATGADAFLVTDSYTNLQKVERAFAAELLAPAAGIRTLLPVAPDEAQGEDVEMVADEFEVSTTLIELQIENQLVG